MGGFHRAHQAVYLDDLARRGVTDWGLVGVGLHRSEMGEVLDAQDRLYLVVERGAHEDRARVIGVMGRYLFGPRDTEAVLGALTDRRAGILQIGDLGDSASKRPECGSML